MSSDLISTTTIFTLNRIYCYKSRVSSYIKRQCLEDKIKFTPLLLVRIGKILMLQVTEDGLYVILRYNCVCCGLSTFGRRFIYDRYDSDDLSLYTFKSVLGSSIHFIKTYKRDPAKVYKEKESCVQASFSYLCNFCIYKILYTKEEVLQFRDELFATLKVLPIPIYKEIFHYLNYE